MYRIASFFLLAMLAVSAAGCTKKATDAATAGETDWAARAAAYKQNPDALRQLVEDCMATEQQLSQLRSQSGASGAALATAQSEAAAAQAEAAQLRQQLAAFQQAANDRVDTDLQTVQGVIFQVQLGAFRENTVDPALSTGDELELDNQNGLQKFVVSQFRNYQSAEVLKKRLVVMGVRDAFIIAKNNGVRIPVAEALRLSGQN